MMSAPPDLDPNQPSAVVATASAVTSAPKQPSGLKGSPQLLGGLMLLTSLGLHAVLFLAPLGWQSSKPQAAAPKENQQIRVTKISKARQKPKPTIKTAAPKPKPTAIAGINPPQPQPEATEATAQKPEEADPNSWKDFPRYPQATPGCFGLEDACSETGDGLNQVAKFFEQELPLKQYVAKPIPVEGDRKAYEVSKGGLLQVLSLVRDPSKGKVYIVLSDKPLTLADLSQASAVPTEVAEILQNLYAADAGPGRFKNPALYFDANQRLRPDVMVAQYAEDQVYRDMMETFFRSNLINNEFVVSEAPVATYGDGEVYEVSKGTLKLYINLIPSVDQTGTIVVIWKDLPK